MMGKRCSEIRKIVTDMKAIKLSDTDQESKC